MSTPTLQAPFPWFGGKSRAAGLIWDRLGRVDNYVEPFAGSLAVLLGAPQVHRTETVNDKDGFVANFWRAIKLDPEQTASHADWPVNENDLHARHAWLVEQRAELTTRLEGDPGYHDPKIAGWWVWGICCWIGSGWCSGQGPWVRRDGKLLNGGSGGVNRQLPHLGNAGHGVIKGGIYDWFGTLAERLQRVRVCCGDWTRVLGPTPTTHLGLTAVVLDPPYSEGERDMDLYATDSGTVAADVRQWAIEHGDDSQFRIALCGYDTEHAMPDTWTREEWRAQGGYSNRNKDNKNKYREVIWFSQYCEQQRKLW